jgi:hypothetical protein
VILFDREGYSPECAPWKGVDLQWVQFPPGNWVAPAGSYRSDGGGNETVGAFETDVSLWRCSEPTGRNVSERRAGLETSNVAPTLHSDGEGRRRWGRMETVGIHRPTSDQNPAGHRGNDDGMSVHGDQRNTGSPIGEGCSPSTRCPRGTGWAASGYGEAHSTVEAG